VLYEHVVNNWPDNERAIYSQRGIVITSLELEEPVAAEAGLEKLFADYSTHKDFVTILSKVAQGYQDKKQFEKARELHRYVVDGYPDSEEAIVLRC